MPPPDPVQEFLSATRGDPPPSGVVSRVGHAVDRGQNALFGGPSISDPANPIRETGYRPRDFEGVDRPEGGAPIPGDLGEAFGFGVDRFQAGTMMNLHGFGALLADSWGLGPEFKQARIAGLSRWKDRFDDTVAGQKTLRDLVNNGSFDEWARYMVGLVGYGGGELAASIAAGGAGALAARTAVRLGTRGMIKKMGHTAYRAARRRGLGPEPARRIRGQAETVARRGIRQGRQGLSKRENEMLDTLYATTRRRALLATKIGGWTAAGLQEASQTVGELASNVYDPAHPVTGGLPDEGQRGATWAWGLGNAALGLAGEAALVKGFQYLSRAAVGAEGASRRAVRGERPRERPPGVRGAILKGASATGQAARAVDRAARGTPSGFVRGAVRGGVGTAAVEGTTEAVQSFLEMWGHGEAIEPGSFAALGAQAYWNIAESALAGAVGFGAWGALGGGVAGAMSAARTAANPDGVPGDPLAPSDDGPTDDGPDADDRPPPVSPPPGRTLGNVVSPAGTGGLYAVPGEGGEYTLYDSANHPVLDSTGLPITAPSREDAEVALADAAEMREYAPPLNDGVPQGQSRDETMAQIRALLWDNHLHGSRAVYLDPDSFDVASRGHDELAVGLRESYMRELETFADRGEVTGTEVRIPGEGTVLVIPTFEKDDTGRPRYGAVIVKADSSLGAGEASEARPAREVAALALPPDAHPVPDSTYDKERFSAGVGIMLGFNRNMLDLGENPGIRVTADSNGFHIREEAVREEDTGRTPQTRGALDTSFLMEPDATVERRARLREEENERDAEWAANKDGSTYTVSALEISGEPDTHYQIRNGEQRLLGGEMFPRLFSSLTDARDQLRDMGIKGDPNMPEIDPQVERLVEALSSRLPEVDGTRLRDIAALVSRALDTGRGKVEEALRRQLPRAARGKAAEVATAVSDALSTVATRTVARLEAAAPFLDSGDMAGILERAVTSVSGATEAVVREVRRRAPSVSAADAREGAAAAMDAVMSAYDAMRAEIAAGLPSISEEGLRKLTNKVAEIVSEGARRAADVIGDRMPSLTAEDVRKAAQAAMGASSRAYSTAVDEIKDRFPSLEGPRLAETLQEVVERMSAATSDMVAELRAAGPQYAALGEARLREMAEALASTLAGALDYLAAKLKDQFPDLEFSAAELRAVMADTKGRMEPTVDALKKLIREKAPDMDAAEVAERAREAAEGFTALYRDAHERVQAEFSDLLSNKAVRRAAGLVAAAFDRVYEPVVDEMRKRFPSLAAVDTSRIMRALRESAAGVREQLEAAVGWVVLDEDVARDVAALVVDAAAGTYRAVRKELVDGLPSVSEAGIRRAAAVVSGAVARANDAVSKEMVSRFPSLAGLDLVSVASSVLGSAASLAGSVAAEVRTRRADLTPEQAKKAVKAVVDTVASVVSTTAREVREGLPSINEDNLRLAVNAASRAAAAAYGAAGSAAGRLAGLDREELKKLAGTALDVVTSTLEKLFNRGGDPEAEGTTEAEPLTSAQRAELGVAADATVRERGSHEGYRLYSARAFVRPRKGKAGEREVWFALDADGALVMFSNPGGDRTKKGYRRRTRSELVAALDGMAVERAAEKRAEDRADTSHFGRAREANVPVSKVSDVRSVEEPDVPASGEADAADAPRDRAEDIAQAALNRGQPGDGGQFSRAPRRSGIVPEYRTAADVARRFDDRLRRAERDMGKSAWGPFRRDRIMRVLLTHHLPPPEAEAALERLVDAREFALGVGSTRTLEWVRPSGAHGRWVSRSLYDGLRSYYALLRSLPEDTSAWTPADVERAHALWGENYWVRVGAMYAYLSDPRHGVTRGPLSQGESRWLLSVVRHIHDTHEDGPRDAVSLRDNPPPADPGDIVFADEVKAVLNEDSYQEEADHEVSRGAQRLHDRMSMQLVDLEDEAMFPWEDFREGKDKKAVRFKISTPEYTGPAAMQRKADDRATYARYEKFLKAAPIRVAEYLKAWEANFTPAVYRHIVKPSSPIHVLAMSARDRRDKVVTAFGTASGEYDPVLGGEGEELNIRIIERENGYLYFQYRDYTLEQYAAGDMAVRADLLPSLLQWMRSPPRKKDRTGQYTPFYLANVNVDADEKRVRVGIWGIRSLANVGMVMNVRRGREAVRAEGGRKGKVAIGLAVGLHELARAGYRLEYKDGTPLTYELGREPGGGRGLRGAPDAESANAAMATVMYGNPKKRTPEYTLHDLLTYSERKLRGWPENITQPFAVTSNPRKLDAEETEAQALFRHLFNLPVDKGNRDTVLAVVRDPKAREGEPAYYIRDGAGRHWSGAGRREDMKVADMSPAETRRWIRRFTEEAYRERWNEPMTRNSPAYRVDMARSDAEQRLEDDVASGRALRRGVPEWSFVEGRPGGGGARGFRTARDAYRVLRTLSLNRGSNPYTATIRVNDADRLMPLTRDQLLFLRNRAKGSAVGFLEEHGGSDFSVEAYNRVRAFLANVERVWTPPWDFNAADFLDFESLQGVEGDDDIVATLDDRSREEYIRRQGLREGFKAQRKLDRMIAEEEGNVARVRQAMKAVAYYMDHKTEVAEAYKGAEDTTAARVEAGRAPLGMDPLEMAKEMHERLGTPDWLAPVWRRWMTKGMAHAGGRMPSLYDRMVGLYIKREERLRGLPDLPESKRRTVDAEFADDLHSMLTHQVRLEMRRGGVSDKRKKLLTEFLEMFRVSEEDPAHVHWLMRLGPDIVPDMEGRLVRPMFASMYRDYKRLREAAEAKTGKKYPSVADMNRVAREEIRVTERHIARLHRQRQELDVPVLTPHDVARSEDWGQWWRESLDRLAIIEKEGESIAAFYEKMGFETVRPKKGSPHFKSGLFGVKLLDASKRAKKPVFLTGGDGKPRLFRTHQEVIEHVRGHAALPPLPRSEDRVPEDVPPPEHEPADVAPPVEETTPVVEEERAAARALDRAVRPRVRLQPTVQRVEEPTVVTDVEGREHRAPSANLSDAQRRELGLGPTADIGVWGTLDPGIDVFVAEDERGGIPVELWFGMWKGKLVRLPESYSYPHTRYAASTEDTFMSALDRRRDMAASRREAAAGAESAEARDEERYWKDFPPIGGPVRDSEPKPAGATFIDAASPPEQRYRAKTKAGLPTDAEEFWAAHDAPGPYWNLPWRSKGGTTQGAKGSFQKLVDKYNELMGQAKKDLEFKAWRVEEVPGATPVRGFSGMPKVVYREFMRQFGDVVGGPPHVFFVSDVVQGKQDASRGVREYIWDMLHNFDAPEEGVIHTDVPGLVDDDRPVIIVNDLAAGFHNLSNPETGLGTSTVDPTGELDRSERNRYHQASVARVLGHELGHMLLNALQARIRNGVEGSDREYAHYKKLVGHFHQNILPNNAALREYYLDRYTGGRDRANLGDEATENRVVGDWFQEWFGDRVAAHLMGDRSFDFAPEKAKRSDMDNLLINEIRRVARMLMDWYRRMLGILSPRAAKATKAGERAELARAQWDLDGEFVSYLQHVVPMARGGPSDGPKIISRQKSVAPSAASMRRGAAGQMKRAWEKARPASEGVREFWRSKPVDWMARGLLPSVTTMRTRYGVAGKRLADFFEPRAGRNRLGELEGMHRISRRAQGRMSHALLRALRVEGNPVDPWSDARVRRILLEAEDDTKAPDDLSPDARRVRELFHVNRGVFGQYYHEVGKRRLHTTGHPGFRDNYFPRQLDIMALENSPEARDALVRLLERYGDATREDATEMVRHIVRNAIDPEIDAAGVRPDPAAAHRRSFAFIPTRELRLASLLLPPEAALASYSHQVGQALGFETMGGQKAIDDALGRADSEEDRVALRHMVEGELGLLAKDAAPWARKLADMDLLLQAVTVLPLSYFASVPELVMPLVRGAGGVSVGQAMRALFNAEDRATADELTKVIGANMPAAAETLYSSMGAMYSSAPGVRKGLSRFFRYSGMEAIMRASRRFATGVGRDFLVNAARDPETARNKRFLNELGLTHANGARAVLAWERAGFPATGPKAPEEVLRALETFVYESVVTPNPSTRPSLGNDPRFALLYTLKAFFYAFGNQVLAGNLRRGRAALAEGDHGLVGQMLLMTAGLVLPVTAIALEAREGVKFGARSLGQGLGLDVADPEAALRTDDMGALQYASELMSRSGLYGPFSIVDQAYRSWAWGENPIVSQIPAVDAAAHVLSGDLSRITPFAPAL